jgi:hypothetical protein
VSLDEIRNINNYWKSRHNNEFEFTICQILEGNHPKLNKIAIYYMQENLLIRSVDSTDNFSFQIDLIDYYIASKNFIKAEYVCKYNLQKLKIES